MALKCKLILYNCAILSTEQKYIFHLNVPTGKYCSSNGKTLDFLTAM